MALRTLLKPKESFKYIAKNYGGVAKPILKARGQMESRKNKPAVTRKMNKTKGYINITKESFFHL
jgi:hypothetical protein